jgi:phosphopantothenoylcysteine decarboxylase/phosphopantothenate--cysteine ligase
VLAADGSATPVPFGAKDELAESVWTMVRARLPSR